MQYYVRQTSNDVLEIASGSEPDGHVISLAIDESLESGQKKIAIEEVERISTVASAINIPDTVVEQEAWMEELETAYAADMDLERVEEKIREIGSPIESYNVSTG